MGDISKGFAFSGNSPNNAVTAANLNNLVDNAVIQETFYTGKSVKSSPASGDIVLIWDSASSTFKQVSIQNLIPQAAQRTGFSQLQMYNGGTGNLITVSATEIVMATAGGNPFRVTSFTATVNIQTYSSGPTVNGRDFPSFTLTNGQWGYVWAISNGTLSGLIYSLSASTPTLPTGYIYYVLLGAARCGKDGNLVNFFTCGTDAAIHPGPIASTAHGSVTDYVPRIGSNFLSVLTIGTAGNFAEVDLSYCVPPMACRVRGIIAADASGNNYGYGLCPSDPTNGFIGTPPVMKTTNVGISAFETFGRSSITTLSAWGFSNAAMFDVPIDFINTPQLVWLASDSAAAVMSMRVTGYKLPI